MGALSDIQEILRSDNLDNPMVGIKSLMEAWVEELTNAAPPVASVAFTYGGLLYQDARAFPASIERQGAFEGFDVTITTLPLVVAALGTVIDVATINAHIYNLPLTDDQFDLGGTVKVSNTAGTQVATAHKVTVIDTETDAGSINWSGATTAVPTGTDLTWTTTAVASTAGGIFVVTLVFSGGWD